MTDPTRPRRRKVLVLSTAAMILMVGVAGALFLYRATITGESEVVQEPRVLFTGDSAVLDTNGPINCSVVRNDEELDVQITDAIPGASCDVEARVARAGGQHTLRVQDVAFNDDVEVAFVTGCGANVQNTPSTEVVMRFTIAEGAEVGTTPASSEAGVVAALADDYDDEACPRS